MTSGNMTDTFSTPAEHAFEHDEIEAIAGPSTMGDATEELSVVEAFEVENTIKRIREGGFKTVSHHGLTPFEDMRQAMKY
jgi:diphthamide biosynthesis protein 2